MSPIKYQKTFHLPWTKTITNDDKILTNDELLLFHSKTICTTIKMDGEGTSIYPDQFHARSPDSKYHPSRSRVKQLYNTIKDSIPIGWRICGENLYAKHSIYYENLDSYFMVYSIWDENNICLPLNETLEWCELLNLIHVPIITIMKFNENKLKQICNELDTNIHEGIVIRNIEQFHYDDFKYNVAKFVRENHVQTDDHWMYQKIVPNKLKGVSSSEQF